MNETEPCTLPDLLHAAARHAPDQGIVDVASDGSETVLTHRSLMNLALRVAAGLRAASRPTRTEGSPTSAGQDRGPVEVGHSSPELPPGTPVIVLPGTPTQFLPAFWGALLAGLIPVPLAPARERVLGVWRHLDQPPIILTAIQAGRLTRTWPADANPELLDIADLQAYAALDPRQLPEPKPDDLAFLQFSSGSTGTPRGVELTHACVLADIAQARAAGACRADDVLVSWLPYFHDMGLIGAHLTPLAAGARQVVLQPQDFAKRPALWFETTQRHRGTVLPMASFALALTVDRVPVEQAATWDLSTVRLVGVGAEPIAVPAWRRFLARLRPAGLAPEALTPMYGLAEATLAVTFPVIGEVTRPLTLDRRSLAAGVARDGEPGDSGRSTGALHPVDAADQCVTGHEVVTYVEYVEVGRAVEGGELRIVDDAGAVLPDDRVGQIEFRGPNVARGYHRRPSDTARIFGTDGWLRTGDLGFLREGRLCVTGRAKDVLFVNGQKVQAHDVEDLVASTPGLPTGRVAVVGISSEAHPAPGAADGTGAERVVVFVPNGGRPPDQLAAVMTAVRARVREALAYGDVVVLPLSAATFPRTTSGKLQRSRLRDMYAAGDFAELERAWSPAVAGPEARVRETTAPEVAEEAIAAAPPGQPGQAPPPSRRQVEAAVAAIWAEVLGVPATSFGRDDRFLAIGGTSLSAMHVLGRLEETFDRTLEPAVLIDCATVAALADHLLGNASASSPSAPAAASMSGPVSVPATGRGAQSAAQAESSPLPEGESAARVAEDAAPAVIGMACRFPDADSPESFWANLMAGRDSVTEIPAERWRTGAGERARWGAFLDDVAGFDADFFSMSDDEAALTDPHARVFLEVAHEALERAGYAGPRRIGRRIGVFVAVGESGYPDLLHRARAGGAPGATEPAGRSGDPALVAPSLAPAALTGNLRNLIAARVAHALDLTGPAVAIDTACSSALVALHLARRSLADGECDIAVVGAVGLHLTDSAFRLLDGAQALSRTGRSRAFSADADGFVPGEGSGALVLTSTASARHHGDPILAVVRGSAVAGDGRSLSLLAPNPARQREVLAAAYQEAGVDPGTVSYVEAHGTGTTLGDPIEARSLIATFPAPKVGSRSRLVGSVKTNIGHLLNAAGIASLIKVILALQHRTLPPSLHHTATSPQTGLIEAGFAVVTAVTPWTSAGPLRAGINGFGFGGTNAHVILEEAPPPTESAESASPAPDLLTLSAASPDALRAAVGDLAAHVRRHPELTPGQVCVSAALARDDRPYRVSAVIGDDLGSALDEAAVRVRDGSPRTGRRPRVVFAYPGQGAQLPQLGTALYAASPIFRNQIDTLSRAAGAVEGRDLRDWLIDPAVTAAELVPTAIAQPVLVAYALALTSHLDAWGVRPDAVVGHSVGELAALAVSGACLPEQVVRFAVVRGRVMAAQCQPGAMAAVLGDPSVVAAAATASGTVEVAALNGPAQSVLAGPRDALDTVLATLAADGFRVRRLHTSHAFHSALVDPAAGALAAAADLLQPVGAPRTPLISTVTGQWSPQIGETYVVAQARRPVLFAAAVERLLDDGFDTFVEVGPGSTLSGLITATARERRSTGVGAVRVTSSSGSVRQAPGHLGSTRSTELNLESVAVLPLLAGERDEQSVLRTVGRLWERGVPVTRPVDGRAGGRLLLPTYPFQHRRHWWPDRVTRPVAVADSSDQTHNAVRGGAGDSGRTDAVVATEPRPGKDSDRARSPLLHRFRWVDAPLPAGASVTSVAVVGSHRELSRRLADRLARRGIDVRASGFAGLEHGGPASTVLLLAGEARAVDPAAEPADDPGVAALLELARRVQGPSGPHSVIVVTEDVQVTGAGAEHPRPGQALVTGLAMALADESAMPGAGALPDLAACGGCAVRVIDLCSLDDHADRVTALIRELDAPPKAGPAELVAWRGERRLAREPAWGASGSDSTASAPPDRAPRRRGHGGAAGWPYARVLITGGRGGIGRLLGAELIRRGTTELVLVGRAPAPDAAEVAQWAAAGATGAQVSCRSVDIADPSGVAELVSSLPPLDLVVHAAGTVRPGLLRTLTPVELDQLLAAKVRGTVLLSRALERTGARPGLFVSLGSVAATLPGLAGGLAAYAAGNAFLDAYAAAESYAGRPHLALSLAAWSGVGMAQQLPVATAAAVSTTGAAVVPQLDPTAALGAVFDALGVARTMPTPAAQLLIAARPGTSGATPSVPVGAAVAARAAPSTRPASTTDAPAHRAALSTVLAEIVADALRVPRGSLDPDASFHALGVDSLTAVDLVRTVEEALGRTLPTTLLFEYPSIAKLAAHLADEGADSSPAETVAAPRVAASGGEEAAASEPEPSWPLTPVQQALLTLTRLFPDAPPYAFLRQSVAGPLDQDVLARSLAALQRRHPMLRMRLDPERARQLIPAADPADTWPFWFQVRSDQRPADTLADEFCNLPFRLGEAPIRAVLVTHSADRADLSITAHHAAADGASLSVLAEELWQVYAALVAGRHPDLPALRSDFGDHAAVVEASRQPPRSGLHSAWWSQRLMALDGIGDLPCDGEPVEPRRHVAYEFRVDDTLTRDLQRRAAELDVSLFHLVLSAYARRLRAWTGADRIAVDVARAGRDTRLPDIARVVGPFADTVPLVLDVPPDRTLAELTQRVRDEWLAVELHADGLDEAAAGLAGQVASEAPAGAARLTGRAGFSFARFPLVTERNSAVDRGCPVRVVATAARTGSARTRLTLLAWEFDQALHFSWNYPVGLFDDTTLARFSAEVVAELSAAVLPPPQATVLVAPDERPAPPPAAGPSLVERIWDQCAKTPEAVAVVVAAAPTIVDSTRDPRAWATSRHPLVDGAALEDAQHGTQPDQSELDTTKADGTEPEAAGPLSYAELDRASRRVATVLGAAGARPGHIVGLLTEPGPTTLTGLLGILGCGAGWLPLDVAHPALRLADQLRRTGAWILVCDRSTRPRAEELLRDLPEVVAVDLDDLPSQAAAGRRPAQPLPSPRPEATAYVIFTSGTTGRPKGVPITYAALTGYLDWALATFGYGPGDRLAATASICFDASVRQLLAPLLVGATIVAVPRSLARDPEALLDQMVELGVTVWSSVPTLWGQLIAVAERRAVGRGPEAGGAGLNLSALRWIHVGGEALPPGLVRRWFALAKESGRKAAPVANLYGPTEATINVTCEILHDPPPADVVAVPIGRPIGGRTVLVVDKAGAACPDGRPGELWVAGIGLSPGYLDDPDQTARSFVQRHGRRWYRTGDRVLRRPDGRLDYLGRIDRQVKIRGHRVEPDELARVLERHPEVDRAVVIARPRAKDVDEGAAAAGLRLLAYVLPGARVLRTSHAGEESASPAADLADMADLAERLYQFLGNQVPEHLMPAHLRLIREVPVNASGKVDEDRLDDQLIWPDRPAEPDGSAGEDEPAGEAGRGRSDAVDGRRGGAPATSTERLLAEVWAGLLDVDVGQVRRDDDFFGLGGDSIAVIELITRLEPHRTTLPAPGVVYRQRTLRALAALIDDLNGDNPAVVDAMTVTPPAQGAPFPLTAVQRGFLLAEALAPQTRSSWLGVLRVDGALDAEVLQRAVDAVVERHLMLRVRISPTARPPTQCEVPHPARIVVQREPHGVALSEVLARERAYRFGLGDWPLLRLRLVTTGPEAHALLMHAHHLIGDGFSVVLLVRELLAGYDDLAAGRIVEWPALRSTFRDFAELSSGTTSEAPQSPGGAGPSLPPYLPPRLRTGDRDADHSRPGSVAAQSGAAPGPGAAREVAFSLPEATAAGLRRRATADQMSPVVPLVAACHLALAELTGQSDLVLGLADSGRDLGRTRTALPDLGRLIGPFALVRPIRITGVDSEDGPHLARVARAIEQARSTGASLAAPGRAGGTDPFSAAVTQTAQFLISILDFSAVGPLHSDRLRVRWDDTADAYQPPPIGTDLLITVRPGPDELRVVVRASPQAVSAATLAGFADHLRSLLLRFAGDPAALHDRAGAGRSPAETPPAVHAATASAAGFDQSAQPSDLSAHLLDTALGDAGRVDAGRVNAGRVNAGRVDAALVGYLPAPAELARLLGLPATADVGDTIRRRVFPDGRPRILQELVTPLGRSAYICLPLFADQLGSQPALAELVADGVHAAGMAGARTVSLAGMLPAHTGYGFEIGQMLGPAAPRLTTGHATTAASVLATVEAALLATGRSLGACRVSMVGLGSIGGSVLDLLLAVGGPAPLLVTLCDLPARAHHLDALAARLAAAGHRVRVVLCGADQQLPGPAYDADLIVGAISAARPVLAVNRLRAGTVVVDDSFPHCFDTAAAWQRMNGSGDVLIVGGGLLSCGSIEERVPEDLPGIGVLPRLRPGGTVPSCQLESLLLACRPELRPVRGLADPGTVQAYQAALSTLDVTAAPLHLGPRLVPDALTAALRQHLS